MGRKVAGNSKNSQIGVGKRLINEWEEKTTNQRKFQQTRYCRMSIVKKLPAVLMAAVGMSFSLAGAALAETIVIDKTVAAGDSIEVPATPDDMRSKTICFQTTDNKNGYIMIMDLMSQGIPELTRTTPQQQCVSKSFNRLPGFIDVIGPGHPALSQSIRVIVKQP